MSRIRMLCDCPDRELQGESPIRMPVRAPRVRGPGSAVPPIMVNLGSGSAVVHMKLRGMTNLNVEF